MLDEFEVDPGLVAGAQAIGRHVQDGGGLADGAAVHHSLVPGRWQNYNGGTSKVGQGHFSSVPGGDGRRVVQHHDVPLKLPAGLRVQLRRNHHHSWSFK